MLSGCWILLRVMGSTSCKYVGFCLDDGRAKTAPELAVIDDMLRLYRAVYRYFRNTLLRRCRLEDLESRLGAG